MTGKKLVSKVGIWGSKIVFKDWSRSLPKSFCTTSRDEDRKIVLSVAKNSWGGRVENGMAKEKVTTKRKLGCLSDRSLTSGLDLCMEQTILEIDDLCANYVKGMKRRRMGV